MNNQLDGSEILFGKRQSPKILKALDDVATEVNNKIRIRGIAKGMVCVQEDFNKEILRAEKLVTRAYANKDVPGRISQLEEIDAIIKAVWVDIRYMLKQHTLTIGEIGVLSAKTKAAQTQLEDWLQSTKDRQCKDSKSKAC